MSDVREQLIALAMADDDRTATYEGYVDAIMERFDVVEKPVVSDGEMASMIGNAFRNSEQEGGVLMNWNLNVVANRLAIEFQREGLQMVKVSDAS